MEIVLGGHDPSRLSSKGPWGNFDVGVDLVQHGHGDLAHAGPGRVDVGDLGCV